MKEKLFMFAVKQHQRRREGRLNITWLINLLFIGSNYHDYCMESWIAWKINNK